MFMAELRGFDADGVHVSKTGRLSIVSLWLFVRQQKSDQLLLELLPDGAMISTHGSRLTIGAAPDAVTGSVASDAAIAGIAAGADLGTKGVGGTGNAAKPCP